MSRLFISLIAATLLGLSVYIGVLINASSAAISPMADVDSWRNSRIVPDEGVWQQSFDKLQNALRLDPNNIEYLASEAMLYRYKAFVFKLEAKQSVAAHREALKRYQHLTSLRPSWAPYWGIIVSIKYDLWEFDDLMIAALHNAARLAPWFKANQHIILRAGFHGWPFLDIETRAVVNETLERAMLFQPHPTIAMAGKQGYLERVLPYVEKDEELRVVYDRAVAARKKRLK